MGTYDENLLIKTFFAETPEEMDKKINDFGAKNTIRATQSNPTYDFHRKKVVYIYTVFYLPQDKVPTPEDIKVETVTGPKLSKLPQKVIDEKDAQWCDCVKCGSRWKWTHFKMCRNYHSLDGLPKEHHELYKQIWVVDGEMEDGNKTNNQMDKGV